MIIALDYDKTYTLDPHWWDSIIISANLRKHTVICVTMRRPDEAIEMPCQVYYTSRKAKKPHMEALGIYVDVWIDDQPGWIFSDGT